MGKKVLYLTKGTMALVKLFAIGKKTGGEVVRDAVLDLIEGGKGVVIDYVGGEKLALRVDDYTHYLVNRLKVEMDYEVVDELVFDAMVNYCVGRGIPVECVEHILEAVGE